MTTIKDKLTKIDIKNKDGKVIAQQPWLPAHEAIVWFRNDYPGATGRICTRIEDPERSMILAEVWVRNDDGKMELVSTARVMGDGRKSIEKLETAAIRRALAYFGYGTTAAMAEDDPKSGQLSPEEEAQVAASLRGKTVEDFKRDLGSGPSRRLGGEPSSKSEKVEFTFPGFDHQYVYSVIDPLFSGGYKHRDNALAKLVREGVLHLEMSEDTVIAAVFEKYGKSGDDDLGDLA